MRMRFYVHRLVLAVALCGSLAAATPQSPEKPAGATEPAPPPAAKPQFFAGSVMEIGEQQVKVARILVGRPNEPRVFLIDAHTKINRTLVKVNARVTVRYLRLPEGNVALEIQPRPAVHAKP